MLRQGARWTIGRYAYIVRRGWWLGAGACKASRVCLPGVDDDFDSAPRRENSGAKKAASRFSPLGLFFPEIAEPGNQM